MLIFFCLELLAEVYNSLTIQLLQITVIAIKNNTIITSYGFASTTIRNNVKFNFYALLKSINVPKCILIDRPRRVYIVYLCSMREHCLFAFLPREALETFVSRERP